MIKLKTLKDIEFKPREIRTIREEKGGENDWIKVDDLVRHQNNIIDEAIKDLLNIYNLEEILKIKLNDKTIGILNKYIMWKFNLTKEGLK